MKTFLLSSLLCSGRLFLFLAFPNFAGAQTVQVGQIGTEVELRNLQLISGFNKSVSFTSRPLVYKELNGIDSLTYKPILKNIGRSNVQYAILPLSIKTQFNSHHPYGWNDAAMISAKGFQSVISAGLYVSAGPFSIQLQPEYIRAVNPVFENNTEYGTSTTQTYSKAYIGQTSVRLNAFGLSVGISTENLWWGPGIRSSLLMSNNAPGFPHLTFNTTRPVKTGVGSFEWQLIGGEINHTNGRLPFENANLKFESASPLNDTRYLSGLVITYQPKWVPGFFIGFTRAIQTYTDDNDLQSVGFFEKYFPVIALAIEKKNVANEDLMRRDQLASFFLRWVFPKAKSEFYIEYGYNDYGVSTRDYLLGPSHSAAYIAGIKKVVPIKNNKRIDIGLEITQISQTPDWMTRDAGNWYTHAQVWEGYTYQNQILGAGAGLGANVQSITANWVDGWKQLGLLIERVERDPQVHNINKWIDLGIGILPQWKYNTLIFSGKLELVSSKRYMWEAGLNRLNLHSRLGITYLF